MKSEPKTLYYYCSLDTFFNILNNSSIWLTEIGKSNDALEQKYLPIKILEKIDDYFEDFNEQLIGDKKAYLTRDSIMQWIESYQPVPVWAICLSSKKDDLSQWRGYSDDAQGISIGFNFSYLKDINILQLSEQDRNNVDFIRLRNIEYGKEAINNYYKFLKTHIYKQKLNPNILFDELRDHLRGLLFRPYYKHEAFLSESEWRIIYSKYDSNLDYSFDFETMNADKEFGEKFELLNRKYEVRNGFLQSHIEIGIIDLLSAIDNIYIGPKSKVTETDIWDYLYTMFRSKELKKKKQNFINKSIATYR